MYNLNKNSVTVTAAAKVNLSLNITGIKNNLHTLDMVMTTINLYDEAKVKFTNGNKIEIESQSALQNYDEARFNAVLYAAAEKFVERYGEVGVKISLTKNIPLGAGLGGSSAGIVCVIRALTTAYNLQKQSPNNGETEKSDNSNDLNTQQPQRKQPPLQPSVEFLMSLGSDVPYMYYGGGARITGVGDVVEEIKLPKLYFLMVVPPGGVDSGEAYKTYDGLKEKRLSHGLSMGINREGININGISANILSYGASENDTIGKFDEDNTENRCLEAVNPHKIICERFDGSKFETELKNDLHTSAVLLNEHINKAEEMLTSAGAERVILSGSGSAVAGVFISHSKAELALKNLKNGENKKLKYYCGLFESVEKTQAVIVT